LKDGKPWRQRKAEKAQRRIEEGLRQRPVTQTTRKRPKVLDRHPVTGLKLVPPDHNPHAERGIRAWKVEQMWNGETVCLIGGGPSLRGFDLTPTQGFKTIAINNSYLIAPWAQLLHFADAQWWQWNKADVLARWPEDRLISTATSDTTTTNEARLLRLWRDRNDFSFDPCRVYGWDSGNQAINLAYHLGARRIVLFGFDMRPAPDGATQWHNLHKRVTLTDNYQSKFIPALKRSISMLKGVGVEVVRATEPGIAEAPYLPLNQALVQPISR